VSASLGTILFFPLRLTVVEAERKKKLSYFLKSYEFIKRIVRRMGYSDTNALSASDFLFRIIDECTRVESSEVITSCMEDTNDCLVDWVFQVCNDAISLSSCHSFLHFLSSPPQVLFSKAPGLRNAQRASCFKVMLALLTKSAPKEFEVPVTTGNFYTNAIQKTPNGLADVHDIVQRKIIDAFFSICEVLHDEAFAKENVPSVKFGKYEVKSGFPSMRLGALEVMFEGLRPPFYFQTKPQFSQWQQQYNYSHKRPRGHLRAPVQASPFPVEADDPVVL